MSHPKTEIEIVTVNQNNKPVTTSLKVAEVFGKRHKNIMQAIRNLECSEDYRGLNFQLTQQIVVVGVVKRNIEYFEMTRDGFILLAMGFNGKKATEFKIAYIEAFNKMEQALLAANPIPPGLPDFRDPIKAAEAWIEAEGGRREEKKKRIAAQKKVGELESAIDDHQQVLRLALPKVKEHQQVLGDNAKMTMTTVANHFQNAYAEEIEAICKANSITDRKIGVRKFINHLVEKGILQDAPRTPPHQKYVDLGWFVKSTTHGPFQTLATPKCVTEILKFEPIEVIRSWYGKPIKSV